MFSSVVGIDPSLTGTAVSLFNENAALTTERCPPFRKEHKEGDRTFEVERMRFVMQWLTTYLRDTSRLAVIEGFSFGNPRGGGTVAGKAYETGGLGYMIRYWMFTRGITFIEVAPTQLKKFIGAAKKDMITKEVFRVLGIDVHSHDEADAVVLCHIGMSLVGRFQPTTKAQREVLAVITKSHPNVALPIAS